MSWKRFSSLLLALSLWSPGLAAPDPAKERSDYIRNHYGKYEFRIPMRDGKRLFTSAYVPNGVHFGKRYPVLLMRTPYSVAPYGLELYKSTLGPNLEYEKEGFIFVFQDVRGRWQSEGEFVNMRPQAGPAGVDEVSDAYDTIDWIVKNLQGNNGKVGLWGISYPGFYAAAGAIRSHPALRACSPQAPICDWWQGDDMHRNGAFNLQMSFGFFANFGRPRPQPTEAADKPFEYPTSDAYQYFLDLGPVSQAARRFGFDNAIWKEICQHPNYDQYWQRRNLKPHLKGITAATMVVGGWYDTEDLYGPLNIYESIRRHNPTTAVHLVMGPWVHGGWWRTEGSKLGDADFGAETSRLYQQAELNFFRHHLKGADPSGLPRAWIFETGANRWRSFPQWPPPNLRPRQAYLQGGGKIDFRAPSQPGFEEFLSDPAKPVPYTALDRGSVRQSKAYMAEDQRFVANRPDVVSFQTEPFQEDLTLAGPLEVDLWVSTSGRDSDWVVKLIDVNPGKLPAETNPERYRGHQQTLVRGEPFRGRFRESGERPLPFEPGQPTRIRFRLNDVCHTFQRHHRLMIQIHSSWFPYIDRNPQSWVENIFEARPQDFVKAVQRIYHQPEHPSSVTLPVLTQP